MQPVPAQHGCPLAPHVFPWHPPLAQVPPYTEQVEPWAVQVPFSQQPVLHWLYGQHGAPGWPHCTTHVLPLHIRFDPLHPPLQQGWLSAPHETQVLVEVLQLTPAALQLPGGLPQHG